MMSKLNWLRICLLSACFFGSINAFSGEPPTQSIVIFGDSLSDIGNTTHLLDSLRFDQNPAWLVKPFKQFVLNKMQEFAQEYYVPQVVLDEGITIVTRFFDYDLAPLLAVVISNIQPLPDLPGKPYWHNRFSNGPVWNEYLAFMLHIDPNNGQFFNNQAFGGSWAATYDHQLTVWNLIRHPINMIKDIVVGKLIPPSIGITEQAQILETPELNPKALYFIFAGGNDYLNALRFEKQRDPVAMSAYIDNVIDSLDYAIKKLVKAGANHLIIFNLPDVGISPHFLNTPLQTIISDAVMLHNQRLQERIETLAQEMTTVDFLYVDIQSKLQKVLTNPSKYGFNNITEACIDVKLPLLRAAENTFTNNWVLNYTNAVQTAYQQLSKSDKPYHVCETPNKFLFWDEIHPTTRAHHFLAYEICLAMKAHGYPANCQTPRIVA